MTELQMHDPFLIPDELELENEVSRPKWWYAAQLRVAGASWEDIAKAIGYDDALVASRVVHQNKRKRTKEELEDLVDLELERLDALQLACWRTAMAGDPKAISSILGVMVMRMRLTGTEKKVGEGQTTNNTAIFIGGSEDEYRAALAQARDTVKSRRLS